MGHIQYVIAFALDMHLPLLTRHFTKLKRKIHKNEFRAASVFSFTQSFSPAPLHKYERQLAKALDT